MKHFTKSFYTFVLSAFAVTSLNAQTTIVELDGANNEFVVNDWTLTGPNAFASNPTGIVIDDQESGALSISNSALYSNISAEITFVNTNISFEADMSDGSSTLIATGLHSTGGGAANANTAIVNFNNANGFAISEFRIFAMNANGISEEVTYIHITGTLESGGSSEIPENVKENIFMYTQGQLLKVDSEFNASLEVYSFDGKQVLNEEVVNGLNTFNINDKGMYIVAIRNEKGLLVKRSKVLVK